ncbi:calcium-binding protein [Psychromarinibacter sp. S121]|uniref:calcium-binding protein n=1 Tax=Psychromarinibacter sp. S121 TaxID=3415127 RepID=UPI003C7BD0C9
MSIHIIITSVSTTAAGDHAVDVTYAGDVVLVQPDRVAAASGTGARGIYAAVGSIDVTVGGTVASQLAEAILLASNDNSVTISANGTVLSGSAAGVAFDGTGNQLTNSGTIQSGSFGLWVTGSGMFINAGTMTAVGPGALLQDFAGSTFVNTGTINADLPGIRLEGGGSLVENAGTVISADHAVHFSGSDPGARNTLTNTGSLSGQAGAFLGGDAVDVVRNSGTMSGAIDTGGGADEVLVTDGLVAGDIRTGAGADVLRLTGGTVDGSVDAGDGADILDLRGGIVTGLIGGGAGDDLYIVSDPAVSLAEVETGGRDTVRSASDHALADHIEDLILTGAADVSGTGTDWQNTIVGNAGDNRLAGEGSRDVIEGGGGHDTIDSGRGNDIVDAGNGDDRVAGRAGNDNLTGGEGDDFLFGGIGKDNLFGDDGDDTLKGGGGQDDMTGGAGQDVFVFTRASDSPPTAGDVITDFASGEDLLDFTGLVHGTLQLSLLGSYTAGAPSLRTSESTAGDTLLWVDADGDGSVDLRIRLSGTTGLSESDFLL